MKTTIISKYGNRMFMDMLYKIASENKPYLPAGGNKKLKTGNKYEYPQNWNYTKKEWLGYDCSGGIMHAIRNVLRLFYPETKIKKVLYAMAVRGMMDQKWFIWIIESLLREGDLIFCDFTKGGSYYGTPIDKGFNHVMTYCNDEKILTTGGPRPKRKNGIGLMNYQDYKKGMVKGFAPMYLFARINWKNLAKLMEV